MPISFPRRAVLSFNLVPRWDEKNFLNNLVWNRDIELHFVSAFCARFGTRRTYSNVSLTYKDSGTTVLPTALQPFSLVNNGRPTFATVTNPATSLSVTHRWLTLPQESNTQKR